MSNSLLTIDMITKEAMRIAHEKATFIGTIRRDYDDSFAKTGAKIGSTLRVRKPNRYTRRQGSRVMDVQDQSEDSYTITVATQDGVDMRFNSAELALSIDDFSKRYIEPAMSVLVSGIDSDAIASCTKQTYNYVGTPGTVVGSSSGDISAVHNARARLNQELAPKDDQRYLQLDSVTMAAIANGNKALFLPGKDVSEAFLDGYYGRIAGFEAFENERTWVLTNSTDTTGTADSSASVTDGGTTLDMHTTLATQVVGQVFTISGVYACHPETKASLGYLQQFTITTIANSGVSSIWPPTYLTGAKQNVCDASGGTLTATTSFNSATLTFLGSPSTSYRQNLAYHKEAFAFVTADLPLMDDAAKCVRMNKDGLSVRVWQGSDIRNDELLMRLDILYGIAPLRPSWACRITN